MGHLSRVGLESHYYRDSAVQEAADNTCVDTPVQIHLRVRSAGEQQGATHPASAPHPIAKWCVL